MVEGGQERITGSKSFGNQEGMGPSSQMQTGWRQELRKERGAHGLRAGTGQAPLLSQRQEARQ